VSASAGPGLQVRGLSKTFTGTTALRDVELSVPAGQVHALLGHNGSGKSTLIKILSGFHKPDPGGQVTLTGRRLDFGDAASSYACGARFVHQDLALVESSSVLDNLYLGTGFPTRWATIRTRMATVEARGDLDRVGLAIDVRRRLGQLSAVERTGVALARALRNDPSAPRPACSCSTRSPRA
jgi:ribose transport system ATP-binding protein